jgi:hypothetical protein
VRPLGRWAAGAIGALAFVAITAGVLARGSWRGDFRVDEACKISETAFLRLWIRGDFGNAAWFANIYDRSNPPTGKYVFGMAILLTGQTLPPLPTLLVRDPTIPPIHPPELSAPYRPMLHAVRFASTVSIALTAAILTMLLGRYHGWVSAAFALAFFALSDVTRTFGATGVFDPLFALFFTASIALMTALAARPSARRVGVAGISIGVVTALAFQTRLNGLFAFLIAMPFLWITLRRNIRQALLATALATGVFAATTMILNPYYWSTPATRIEPFSSQNGILRPVERLVRQKQDLMAIAAPLQEMGTESRNVVEKVQYLLEMMLSDLPGLLIVFSAFTGTIILGVRWRSLTPPLRVALLMSLAVVVTMVATLPLPWLRYLLVTVPPLALVGGFAAGEAIGAFLREWSRALAARR